MRTIESICSRQDKELKELGLSDLDAASLTFHLAGFTSDAMMIAGSLSGTMQSMALRFLHEQLGDLIELGWPAPGGQASKMAEKRATKQVTEMVMIGLSPETMESMISARLSLMGCVIGTANKLPHGCANLFFKMVRERIAGMKEEQ